MRAKTVADGEGRFYGIRFNCPGCALMHEGMGGNVLPVRWTPEGQQQSPHNAGSDHWDFNGDFEKPTFHPSVLSRCEWGEEKRQDVCHSFITDGRIQFLSDCTHALAGQTVDLPELEA